LPLKDSYKGDQNEISILYPAGVIAEMQTTAATPVLFALCILCAGQPDPAFVADRHFWLPGLIYFCVVMGQYALTFWLLTLLRNSGVSEPLHNGLLTSLSYLCVIILMLLAGHSFEAALLSEGLVEQRLMSAAAGMAREGFMPFVTPMPCLLTARPMILSAYLAPNKITMSKLPAHCRV